MVSVVAISTVNRVGVRGAGPEFRFPEAYMKFR